MKRTATLKLRLHGNFQKFKAKFISFKTTYCFKLFNMINKILYTTALSLYIYILSAILTTLNLNTRNLRMKCICSKRMLIYLKSNIDNLVLYCCIICFIFYIMNKIFVMKYAKGDVMFNKREAVFYQGFKNSLIIHK